MLQPQRPTYWSFCNLNDSANEQAMVTIAASNALRRRLPGGLWTMHEQPSSCLSRMALLGAGLAATKLKVDTNPALMINGDLPFRQNYNDLITQFPELDNGFVIVIDAANTTVGAQGSNRHYQTA